MAASQSELLLGVVSLILRRANLLHLLVLLVLLVLVLLVLVLVVVLLLLKKKKLSRLIQRVP
jgi:hypothetical protein